jgi:crotonobetaine/carnitine-CoA ligase
VEEFEPSAGQLLRRRAQEVGDHPFVRCGGPWVSYAEMDEASSRIAGALAQMGVQRGDRVVVLSVNSTDMIEVVFGCSKVGAVLVPVNTYLRGELLRHQLTDADATIAFVDEVGLATVRLFEPEVAFRTVVLLGESTQAHLGVVTLDQLKELGAPDPVVSVKPSDLGALVYTSGTTGPSKGCMIPSGAFAAMYAPLHKIGYFRAGDRLLTPAPLFHIGGLGSMLMGPLGVGSAVSFVTQFSASNFMSEAREIQATVLYGVGAAGVALLAQPPSNDDRNHTLRLAVWIPMPEGKADEFQERFGVRTAAESYGQTEFMPIGLVSIDEPPVRGSAGRASSVAEVCVLGEDDEQLPRGEVGEIAVRPKRPHLMFQGYWRQPEASLKTMRNLWHHTGDVGRLDENGNLFIVDRKSDVLRRRGENVSSTQLEIIIRRFPGIDDVAVHGVPSEMGDQEIKACIRMRESSKLEAAEVFAFFTKELPYFAIPRYIEVVEEFPTNANGRVRKDVLRAAGITPDTWDLTAMGFTVARENRRA